MKMVIEQMIDFINDINDNDITEFNYYYDTIIEKLNELLKVEKEQQLLQQEISDEHTTLINAIRQGTGMSIKDAKIALLDVTEDIVELCRQWYRKNGKKF